MNRSYGNQVREESSRLVTRRPEKRKEDEIITIPEFEFSDLIENINVHSWDGCFMLMEEA